MGDTGFEPAPKFQSGREAIAILARSLVRVKLWWAILGSNQRQNFKAVAKRSQYWRGHRFEQNVGGRYWVRTSDLFRVREARYHCANRPGLPGRWRRDLNPRIRLCRPLPRLSATPPRASRSGCPDRPTRADDETRTRDPHLGKVMRYQLRYIRNARKLPCLETLTDADAM